MIEENGQLRIRFGPAFVGTLEHWHYDSFRATFDGPGGSKSPVMFGLNVQGKVDTLTLGMGGMAPYPFKRIADAAKTAATGN